MKSLPHKIIMTNPCHENWAEMTDNSKGKFCASCQTDVIDFTQMSNNEIIDYFKNNNIQKGCGRFYKKQLDTIQIPVDEQIFSYDLKSWQKFLVVVLFCFGQELFQVQLVFAQETNGDSSVISNSIGTWKIDSTSLYYTVAKDTFNINSFLLGSQFNLPTNPINIKRTPIEPIKVERIQPTYLGYFDVTPKTTINQDKIETIYRRKRIKSVNLRKP